jgi:DNA polymerase III subunit gamma/tau
MNELFPPDPVAPTAAPYRVLARKYRPIGFEHLIGQEPMVRTLANSFASGRIHQAYILTGVRGIGKTTTARILARAFNYEVPGKIDRPSIEMPELGVHCQAIIESRHVDVIEMDAASHTGIDDVREIIDNARYRPVSARTKVYIIDEVHMLSKQAFNGLLKTLEEPPEHVKFLFATTEIEKVPVTVRSRCLRFDLKRIDSGLMARHLASICTAECVRCEPEALALLDQAIAHGGDGVRAADLRAMLGLSDRSQTIDLFESSVKGDIAAALAQVGALFDAGADPLQILIDLAEFNHLVTRTKLAGKSIDDPAVSEDERRRGAEFAQKLGVGALTRAWQILLKGVQDVKDSPRPLASVEMALVRLAYAADLPSPEDALRRLAEAPDGAAPRRLAPASTLSSAAPASAGSPNGGGAAARAIAPQSVIPAPAPRLQRFEDVVALARSRRDIQLHTALESDVRLERFEPGQITFSLVEGASAQIAQTLSRRLAEWTGERWMVTLVGGAIAPTLRETAKAAEARRLSGIAAHPLVSKVLEKFPGARIVETSRVEEAIIPPEAPPVTDDDVSYSDTMIVEDEF